MEPEILFEDRDVIVCVKLAGVLSEDGGMPQLLAAHAGAEPIRTVHRLDRAVGGVMVYAKTQSAAAALSAAIAQKRLEKEYLAIVQGCPAEPEGELRDLLYRDAAKNKSFVVTRMRRGVREAVLRYRVLQSRDGLTLLLIRLETGRSHQIRVQFASRGLPLFGDSRYGSRLDGPLALWSYRLRFPHPASRTAVERSAVPPSAEPWTRFAPLSP